MVQGVQHEGSRDGDVAALRALYHATDGVNWIRTWELTANPETWFGVTMNSDGRVVSLGLDGNNLHGEKLACWTRTY